METTNPVTIKSFHHYRDTVEKTIYPKIKEKQKQFNDFLEAITYSQVLRQFQAEAKPLLMGLIVGAVLWLLIAPWPLAIVWSLSLLGAILRCRLVVQYRFIAAAKDFDSFQKFIEQTIRKSPAIVSVMEYHHDKHTLDKAHSHFDSHGNPGISLDDFGVLCMRLMLYEQQDRIMRHFHNNLKENIGFSIRKEYRYFLTNHSS